VEIKYIVAILTIKWYTI